MKTYSHYAYVVTDGSGVGMQIIDLQYLPDSVHLIKAWSPGFTKAHTITQDGRFLYLNAGDASPNGGIRVVDLADPENPVMRGAYTQRLIHDSYIRNDTIFAAAYYDNKFVIINAQDKDNPNVITEFPNIPAYLFPHNCWTTGDRRYLVTTDEGSNPPGSAKIWNIENLNNILYVTSYRPPGTGDNTIVHNVFIRDSLLVISHYEAGLRFVNIRNPAAPVEIGYYDTYPGADSAAFRGNWGCYPFFSSWKFASSDMQTGLWVVKLRRNESKSAIIKLFELQQNYPNPFNVKSKIHYWISKSSHVILSIFDVRGRFITSLVNQQQPIGSFEVEFSGIELSSGVYFYRLQVGEFSEAKKMVLVK
jgi:choice-of-anchor B domain-containing protein